MTDSVLQLYIDEVEVTTQITPQSGLSTPAVAKTITFSEPQTNAAFALKGYWVNEFSSPGRISLELCF
jgi:hypothetical protein